MPATREARTRPIRKVATAIHVAAASAQNASTTDPAELAQEANSDLRTAERCIARSTKSHLGWASRLHQDVERAIAQEKSANLNEEKTLVAQAMARCDRIAQPPKDPEGPLPDTCAAQRTRHLMSARNARAAAQQCRQQAGETKGTTLQDALHETAKEMDQLEERNLSHAWSMGAPQDNAGAAKISSRNPPPTAGEEPTLPKGPEAK